MSFLLRLALATLAALLLTELGLRGYRAAIDQVPPHPDLSVADEWDWARDHLRAGQTTLPGLAEYDPTLGWVVGPKFRGPDGREQALSEARQADVPRLVLVGDSFTRELGGLGSFSPGWEIANLGVPGYGAGQAWLRFHTAGAAYDADVVVFGLYLRDYFRTFRSFRGYAKPTFSLDEAGDLVVEGVPVVAPPALYEAYRTGERRIGGGLRSFVLDFVRQRLALYEGRAGIAEEEYRVFVALLRAFRDDARAAGACPLLVIFPTRPDGYFGTVFETLDRRTRDSARELGLPVLGLADGLYGGVDEAGRRAWFEEGRGRHMSPRGRAEAIRLIDEVVTRFRPGACPEPAIAGRQARS